MKRMLFRELDSPENKVSSFSFIHSVLFFFHQDPSIAANAAALGGALRARYSVKYSQEPEMETKTGSEKEDGKEEEEDGIEKVATVRRPTFNEASSQAAKYTLIASPHKDAASVRRNLFKFMIFIVLDFYLCVTSVFPVIRLKFSQSKTCRESRRHGRSRGRELA